LKSFFGSLTILPAHTRWLKFYYFSFKS